MGQAGKTFIPQIQTRLYVLGIAEVVSAGIEGMKAYDRKYNTGRIIDTMKHLHWLLMQTTNGTSDRSSSTGRSIDNIMHPHQLLMQTTNETYDRRYSTGRIVGS